MGYADLLSAIIAAGQTDKVEREYLGIYPRNGLSDIAQTQL